MITLLDAAGSAAWLRHAGPENVLLRLVEEIATDLRRWPVFDTVARVASHSPVGVIELMPISDGACYAFKFVNGHPGNPAIGRPTVTAFGVLAEVATGVPTFIADLTLLTALRTAAVSALAARCLARADSATMALIGTGSQAEFQALAMRAVLGIERLRIFDTDPQAMAKFRHNVEPLGFQVTVARSAAEAAGAADVVTTATADKNNATILTADMLRPGTHVNAIGGDCPGKTELDPQLLRRAESVVVEYEPQTRLEGEIQQLEPDFPVTELWRLIRTGTTARRARHALTVFDSVGFALADFSALRVAGRATAGTEFVRSIELVAEPADPKDLFGLIAAPARTGVPAPA